MEKEDIYENKAPLLNVAVILSARARASLIALIQKIIKN